MLWGKGWPEVARGTGRVGVRARAAAHAGRAGAHPPRRSIVLPKDQGALARAPTRPAPSALPCSAFAAPARTALRACAPLAIFTVPACSLGRRATAETASAADARGAGGARARASQAGWCLCAASVRRVHVYCYVNSLTHTQTHTNTQARAAENALELAGLGLSPPSLHSGQVRRARARRTAAQLQASCPLSAGQEPCPPLEQRAPWPSEKSQRLRREGRVS